MLLYCVPDRGGDELDGRHEAGEPIIAIGWRERYASPWNTGWKSDLAYYAADCTDSFAGLVDVRPTHWMALPDAPAFREPA